MKPDWKAAYNILMDYWDYIPEEDRITVDRRLKKVLDEKTVVNRAHKGPFKPLSQELHIPPKDCIKNALNRLKEDYGFGIPSKKKKS
jgi:hypothetical protein